MPPLKPGSDFDILIKNKLSTENFKTLLELNKWVSESKYKKEADGSPNADSKARNSFEILNNALNAETYDGEVDSAFKFANLREYVTHFNVNYDDEYREILDTDMYQRKNIAIKEKDINNWITFLNNNKIPVNKFYYLKNLVPPTTPHPKQEDGTPFTQDQQQVYESKFKSDYLQKYADGRRSILYVNGKKNDNSDGTPDLDIYDFDNRVKNIQESINVLDSIRSYLIMENSIITATNANEKTNSTAKDTSLVTNALADYYNKKKDAAKAAKDLAANKSDTSLARKNTQAKKAEKNALAKLNTAKKNATEADSPKLNIDDLNTTIENLSYNYTY